ncbi:hypothetical protein [Streptomyces sp. NPDC058307]|uniref:hypothetical protein n=1 Tax=Streptomyces sp. NPDC058307 TaxID=3346439 RepID=UPI0036EB1F19
MEVIAATAATSGGWTWSQTTALIVPFIAVFGAFLTYALNQRAARREHQAKTFAEALTAVEEYLEMPYRIRRRPESSASMRQQLTDEVSSRWRAWRSTRHGSRSKRRPSQGRTRISSPRPARKPARK